VTGAQVVIVGICGWSSGGHERDLWLGSGPESVARIRWSSEGSVAGIRWSCEGSVAGAGSHERDLWPGSGGHEMDLWPGSVAGICGRPGSGGHERDLWLGSVAGIRWSRRRSVAGAQVVIRVICGRSSGGQERDLCRGSNDGGSYMSWMTKTKTILGASGEKLFKK
jgi:hypothetical protein